MRYYNKLNYYNLVDYNYINYINPSKYYKWYFKDNNNRNSNKKFKLNKDKDNKDNKLKDEVYTTKNNSLGSLINTNIAVTKLNIIAYFINLLFSTRP